MRDPITQGTTGENGNPLKVQGLIALYTGEHDRCALTQALGRKASPLDAYEVVLTRHSGKALMPNRTAYVPKSQGVLAT